MKGLQILHWMVPTTEDREFLKVSSDIFDEGKFVDYNTFNMESLTSLIPRGVPLATNCYLGTAYVPADTSPPDPNTGSQAKCSISARSCFMGSNTRS